MSLDGRYGLADSKQGGGHASGDRRDFLAQSEDAATFLKALSHQGRLMILFHLSLGERSVTELEHRLGSRQAAVSQQLARLRLEGLVTTRREGKAVYYSISDPRVLKMIGLMREMFGGTG